MQITNHLSNRTTTEIPFEVKNGEIYSAQIKERISDKEAVLQIRGKEVVAQFEDKVPSGERATVQVTGSQEQKVMVKEMPVESSAGKKSPELAQVLQRVGITGKEAPELKEAVKLLLDKGQPISKEVVQELKTFFEKAEGTPESKSDTVRALMNKGLEVTQNHLRSIHEALHGKPLNEVLTSIAKELSLDTTRKTPELPVVKSAVQNLQPTPSTTASVPQISPQQEGLREVISAIRGIVESEPDLQKAIHKVKEMLVQNPKIDKETAQQIEKVASDAEKLQSIGKDRIIQALKNAEAQLTVKEQPTQPATQPKVVQQPSGDISPIVKEVRQEVQATPNLQKSIEKVQTEVLKHSQLPKESALQIEKAIQEASALLKQGRITTGKEVLGDALAKLESEISAKREVSPTNVIRNVKEAVQQEPRLHKAVEQVQEQVINNPKIDREVAQKIEKAVQEAMQLQKVGQEGAGRERLVQALTTAEVEMEQLEAKRPPQQQLESRPSEVIKQVKDSVQQEPRLQKAVEQVREQIINNPKIDREVAQKIEKAAQEATQLQKLGQEGAGRERLVQALASAEVEMEQVEAKRTPQQPESRPSEVIKQIKDSAQQESRLQKAVEQVREQIINNPKIDREVSQKIEKAVQEATQLQKMGQEGVGRERLVQALAFAEVEMEQVEAKRTQQQPESRPSDVIKQVKDSIQQEPRLQKAVDQVREQIINNPKIDREVAQKIEKAVQEATQLQKLGHEGAGRERLVQALVSAEAEMEQVEAKRTQQQLESRPSEVIKQVKDSVQQEPRLQKAVDQVREQIINNPKINREVAQKIERAVQEVTQLQQMGREGAGRERLVQALATAEVEMEQVEAKRPQQQLETRPSEVIKQVKDSVQQEPRLQKAVEQVREQIINNPKIDREVAQKIEKAVQEATQLQKVGHEGAGRERLVQALATAEMEMEQVEAKRPSQPQQLEANKASATPAQQNQQSADTRATDSQKQPAPSQEVALKEAAKQIREQLQQETDIKKVLPKLQEQIINNKNIIPEVARSIEKAVNQAQQLDQAGRDRIIKLLQQIETAIKQPTEQPTQESKHGAQPPAPEVTQKLPSETVQQALKQFQSESDLDQAINLVRKEISSNPNIDLTNVSKIEKALDNAQQLNDKGREIAARQQVAKELTDIQQSLAKSEPKLDSAQAASSQYDVNELLQSMQIQSKDILVTRVTRKLAEVTHEFRELKREITKNLDSVQRTIDMFKSSSHPQASKMLETAISKLDNAILKSDMMLFTDMKTEKNLLQASSQLAEAKKLLAKGNYSEASKIVGQVKEMIDKINFKPTDQKVMHFVGKESLAMESKTAVLEAGARGFTMQEPSAKQMFEMVRSMGLNHDSELANSLVFKNDGGQSQQEQQQQNMKAVLMKLQQEEAGTRVGQQAEQALNNLTGQQLLSKADSPGTMQSMLFNLPLFLGGNPENLQVFVNSKTEGDQVDWENCNLYFLIETKRLGDVGIMLASTERNLSITIKNDKPGFKERMEPLATMAKEKLKEIGYNVNSLSFTRMTPIQSESQANQTTDQTRKKPIFTEKGLDFKI